MIRNNPSSNRRYWRSLDELQQKPEFEEFLHREFPVAASEYPEGVSRRRWMQLMGASFAMAGAVGCRYPEETIAPFVIRPEGRVPGETYERSTNFQWANRVHHLMVTCIDGRPIKIENNSLHPSGSAGTDHYVQASILQLYDPDRASSVLRAEDGKRVEKDWSEFDSFSTALVEAGGRLGVIMPPTASPSLVRLLQKLKEVVPDTTLCVYDSVGQGVMGETVGRVTGKSGTVRYDLEAATKILDVDADLLGSHPGFVANARGYAANRNPDDGEMNRLYVVEAGFSSTGMSADSRLALRPSQILPFLVKLEAAIDELLGGAAHDHSDDEPAFDALDPSEKLARFVDVLAHDLVDAKEHAAIAVGESLGSDAVAIGLRMNAKLGAIGNTVHVIETVDSDLGETVSLSDLLAKIDASQIDNLLILGGNPVFTAPSNVSLAAAIKRVDHSIYLGEYDDETGAICEWSLPEAHPLESWGDCVGDAGHYGVCQPQILPLLGGRSPIELLARMLGEDEVDGDVIVRRSADAMAGGSLSDRQWNDLLYNGYDDAVSKPVTSASVAADSISSPEGDAGEPVLLGQSSTSELEGLRDSLEVCFVPSEGLYDGRFANSGWLQEMPDSLTKLTWDNAALLNPITAAALGVKHGTMVALTVGSATVELPVFEIPGMAVGAAIVAFGYGRTRAGAVGGHEDLDVDPVGFDVGPLRVSGSMAFATGVKARPRPRANYTLATTQNHWAIDELGRDETEERSHQLVREGSAELFKILPDFAEYMKAHSPGTGSLWEEPINTIEQENPDLPQWGMAIDLTKCIGCNACVVACQSENNVPIVGKEQVDMGREMHWIRVDRYFQGNEEHAEVVQQPLACQHCETAPCEQVCPVAATVHTDEGINSMAYNRCIGTRYCANNCPYKVRRFNYFNWNEDVGVGYGINAYQGNIENANRKLQQLVLNPDVTVRGRGVMEKCTYCVQRVEGAKINARKEGRSLQDGDVMTACQTACPSSAIEFGNIADEHSRVSHARKDSRNYAMLDQLNITPRTTYLARITNPHVRLMTEQQRDDLKHWPEVAAHHHAGHGEGHGEGHGGEEHGEDHENDHANEGAAEAH